MQRSPDHDRLARAERESGAWPLTGHDVARSSYAQFLAAAAVNPAFPETAACYDLFDRD
jgi:hypothetical protein